MYPAVKSACGIKGEIPGVYCIRAYTQSEVFIETLCVACSVIDSGFELRQHAAQPLVVAGCLVILHRALDDEVFNVGFELEPYKREVIVGVYDAAILIHHFPMPVVELLYQLIILPVRALRLDYEVEKIAQLILEVLHSFHYMDMVAYPVFIDHHIPSINEHHRASLVYIDAQLMQKLAEPVIERGQHSRYRELGIIIRAILSAVYVHCGQFVLKFYHVKIIPFALFAVVFEHREHLVVFSHFRRLV